MKTYIAFIFLAAVCIHEASSQADCSNMPDGVCCWGCRSYTICEGGQGTLVDCIDPEVFNDEILACDDKLNVGPPCGLSRDCSLLEDGKYADLVLNCTAFFTCQDGLFFGHNPCNPGTVFHQAMQICDYPENVPPPCGTKEDED